MLRGEFATGDDYVDDVRHGLIEPLDRPAVVAGVREHALLAAGPRRQRQVGLVGAGLHAQPRERLGVGRRASPASCIAP